MVWLEHLSLLRDAAAVDLVATAVVKVLSCHQEAALVSTGTLSVPLQDVNNLLIFGRVGGTEDEDSASSWRLAGDVPRERDMSVLKVLHGDIVTRADLQLRVLGSVVGGSLPRVAEEVAGVDAGSRCAVGVCHSRVGQHPHHAEAVVGRVGSRNVAA